MIIALLTAIATLATGSASSGAQTTTGAAPAAPVSQGSVTVIEGDPARPALARTISASFTAARLGDVLDQIAERTHVSIVYSDRLVPVDRPVTVRLVAVPIATALERVLAGTGVVVRGSGARFTLVRDERSDTTSREVNGAVVGLVTDSATHARIPGATVTVSGARLETVANDSGRYIIRQVPPGLYVVIARKVGYLPVQHEVLVSDGQIARADFALAPRSARLNQVLVTATGRQRRLDVGNDIVSINVDSVAATAPVSTVTQLLETRVPGLEVQHTSGTPGAPSRIRIRGLSSLNRGNEPILVIDGIRMDIGEGANRSLAPSRASVNGNGYGVSSRLDQIDVNSIETIEVFRGPSASSLYGPDAANGVIVITTKRGRPGPTHWQASMKQGVSTLPGSYPTGIYRWGHSIGGLFPVLCAPTQFACLADSVVRFQALNDRRYAPFDQGRLSLTSLTASGGSATLTYQFTGSIRNETGYLRLPDVEVQRYEKFQRATPPDWMVHPGRASSWSGTSQLTAVLSPVATLSLTSTLASERQQSSSLETAVAQLEGKWVDRSQLDSVALIDGIYERVTSRGLSFLNSAALSWTPRPWLPLNANVGMAVSGRDDATLLPRGLESGQDSLGHYGAGSSRSVTTSANVGATLFGALPRGMRLSTAIGMNLAMVSGFSSSGDRLGLLRDEVPARLDGGFQRSADQTTIGWYLAPTLEINPRLHLSPGFRVDGGSSSGTRARFNGLPKIDVSWVASDERWIPLPHQVNTLRLRVAYGQSTVQPGPTDRLRIYQLYSANVPGSAVPNDELVFQSVGNTKLRPERSSEFEGGFDLGAFADRISIGYSGYVKTRYDAILAVAVAPSVGAGGVYLKNIGIVRNAGAEVTASVEPVRTRLADIRLGTTFSSNVNRLVRLAPGERTGVLGDGTRLVAGYPIFGVWVRPVLGYRDANVDGLIDSSEVVVGDSAVYVGQAHPRYEATFTANVGLFGGRVTVNAAAQYQNRFTQYHYNQSLIALAANDPAAPLSRQAAIAALDRTPYGLIQTVDVLRFSTLSIGAVVSPRLARLVGARTMSVALEGTNLGLRTNYRGIDPSVAQAVAGEGVTDSGQLPQPRVWYLGVRLGN